MGLVFHRGGRFLVLVFAFCSCSCMYAVINAALICCLIPSIAFYYRDCSSSFNFT
jgi:hypothetical protein